MRKQSSRRTHQHRVRLGEHQKAVKEQAIRWIAGLDIVVNITYSQMGDEIESMTVEGIPKKAGGKPIELDDDF